MKTIFSNGWVLLFCLCAFTGFAQVNKDTKIKLKENPLNNATLNSQLYLQVRQIPEFTNVRPTNQNNVVSPNIKFDQLKKATVINNPNLTSLNSSVNSTLTPRNPYHNPRAYIRVYTGNLNPAKNEVDCKCGRSGVTQIGVNVQVAASKRYLVSIEHSPQSGNTGLSLFTNDFVHQAFTSAPNTKTEVVLSSNQNGMITLWVQCSDPNGTGKPWIFHSAEVKELE
ncbi:MAG: hypothetical protein AAFV80_10930 [Bacteroidota bacterium]